MKTLLPLIVLFGVACTPGEGRNSETTHTDTVVTAPARPTDTTVIQKKVDVKVDTLKKTKHAPN